MAYYCGVDIGGTFTDCVLVDASGQITLAKASSTPDDFSQGFLDAIDEAARKRGLDPAEIFPEIELLLHGTTVGTNVLVQMRGAKTGLITTRGHRDALIMMRSYGRSAGLPIERLLHVSRHRKPQPIVPPQLIKEVSERVDWAGEVFLPLHEEEAQQAIRELVDEGVEAIAISFLWGFVNPDHETRVKAMVRELAPDVFVTCAHELIAKPGEYERTAAAAINGYVGPSTSRYVARLDEATRRRGYESSLLIMQAAGGVVPANEVAEAPLFTIGSGPVGGVTGAKFLADVLGHRNVIACDMGGTSFDVGLLHDGLPITSSETVINQYTFFMPRLLIESIGSGGGSIIWVDEQSSTLRVGPESAGAQPGPACYGRGGERPTITDANVLLGRYNPDNFLGGRLELDLEAAERAMRAVAEPLGMSTVEAAAGALRIVEYQMADLMRQMTVEQGLDPREFVVYAYGGAGAAHAAVFGRELGCSEVIVPLGDLASTWSALGVMSSDVLHVYEHAELVSSPFDAARFNAIFEEMEERARRQLRDEGFDDDAIELSRFADMKFSLQIHQVEVPVAAGVLTAADMERQIESFIERYESIYGKGSAFTGAGVQIGVFRLTGRGRIRTPSLPKMTPTGPVPPVGRRRVYWEEHGFLETDIYDGAAMGPGAKLTGPAIVELSVTTIVVQPGQRGRIDDYGSFIVTV
ncbi:MAG: hydantoinase/oxoprolinase family protein [Actinobacteria bacterium]|nr:hydantoinase/oxoprolinase family protein [Actinomycetota bacterium]